MTGKAPGKSHREGISLMELADMFPDEQSAVQWFEQWRWPDGRHCPHCGALETHHVPKAKPMPYFCNDCRSYFSAKTGTSIQSSKLPLRKWVFAIYLFVTSLKGVSSMKLHRDIKVTQKTAWFMLQRLREAWDETGLEVFEGPSQVDESFWGGRETNKHASKRKKGTQGGAGKTIVAGIKDQATNRVLAKVIDNTGAETLQAFVTDNTQEGSTVYTDEAAAYVGLKNRTHETVKHSVGEYVRGQATTNGIESFWAIMRRGHQGIYHKMSPKHLQRYVNEFSGRHGIRESDTIDQMASVIAGIIGKRLIYRNLIEDNGLSSGARG